MERMCSMCRQAKPEDDFRANKHQKKWYGYCSECRRLYNKWYMRMYRERRPDYVEKNRKKSRENGYKKYIRKGFNNGRKRAYEYDLADNPSL